MKTRFIYCFVFFLCCAGLKAQVPVYENYDCNFFKEIIIPFNYSEGQTAVKPILNQTVFYSYRDQFTYWYKIVVKENVSLSFKASAINDSDSYVVFVYQYNPGDFCKKLFNQKVKPVKEDFFTNVDANDNPYSLSEKKFNVQKDNVYYISVMNTSFNNCGHNFILFYGADTLKVKAVHIPCKRDISSLSVKTTVLSKKADTLAIKKMPVVELKKDVIKSVSSEPVLICTVKNKSNNSAIEYKPLITDSSSQEEVQINNISKGEWAVKIVNGNSYKIKCSLLGYKNSVVNVIANGDTTRAIVMLERLKEGDVFVMKSIYFHPNTYALKRESAEELQKLLSYLNSNPNVSIEIQGHTNGDHRIGKNKAYENLGEEWNFSGSAKELSLKRAQAIKFFLETNGIPASRLVPKGLGGKKPIISDPQTNEEGQMNIRVEVVILKA
jgi:outer membrane protein OmpA-like peptidoglycan-associated protein